METPTSFNQMRDQVNEIARFIRDEAGKKPPADAQEQLGQMIAKAVWVVGTVGVQIAQELNEIKAADASRARLLVRRQRLDGERSSLHLRLRVVDVRIELGHVRSVLLQMVRSRSAR